MAEPTDRELVVEDEEDPNEAAIAWAEEIRRRVEEVRSGKAELIPGSEVAARLRALRDGKEA